MKIKQLILNKKRKIRKIALSRKCKHLVKQSTKNAKKIIKNLNFLKNTIFLRIFLNLYNQKQKKSKTP